MKHFHRNNGTLAGSTMTVSELIDKLKECRQDMPVFGTWEGVYGYLTPERFYQEPIHKGDRTEACECLVIDVEEY